MTKLYAALILSSFLVLMLKSSAESARSSTQIRENIADIVTYVHYCYSGLVAILTLTVDMPAHIGLRERLTLVLIIAIVTAWRWWWICMAAAAVIGVGARI